MDHKKFMKEISQVFPNAIQTHPLSDDCDGIVDLKSSSDPKENLTLQIGFDYVGLLKGDPEEFNELHESSYPKMVAYLKTNYKKS